LRVQKLLRRAGGNLVQPQRAVKGRVQHVSFFNGAAFAFQPDCLLALAGKMRGELHAELLVRSEIADIEIDMVIHGTGLMLLEIGDGDLPVIDEQIRQCKLARGLLGPGLRRRRLRSCRSCGGCGCWRLYWSFLRSGRLWFLSQGGKIPDALRIAHQFNVRMHQLQRIHLKLLAQQRPELDANSQLVRRGERTIGGKVRVLCNHGVLHVKGRGEQTQAHIAECDLPSEPFLKLRLNLPVILIHVNQVGHNKNGGDQYNDNDGDCDTKFAHGCLD
jgi:hypothetical protein